MSQPSNKKNGGAGCLGLLVVLFVIGSIGKGCSSSGSGGSGGSGGGTSSSYSATSTCSAWLNNMSYGDQLSISRSLIAELNAYDQSSSYAASFFDDISTACQPPADDLSIAEVARSIAILATADFPPQ
jgi:hypothetical protein